MTTEDPDRELRQQPSEPVLLALLLWIETHVLDDNFLLLQLFL